ncbi:hypothetical protein Tph_c10600 [Thermacetogenium phaeum DSM 12270]|uniref:Uncharacterized protein n=1 Tax=Thermacetogenium phaeum (strain ATCC BAA-254 / DSM 26808 / PB) TaxID=1089553 RepID=K4LGW9_THEPS|nr:hypothetical protein [Thermacetogenium phaeum]AFV11282.1 hypothetical protein Tph_c10600 [Thermacetogenium phaeum DSM 12270]
MEAVIDYENIESEELADLAEVLKALERTKRPPKAFAFDFEPGKEGASGSGYVTDSFFVATRHKIFWIVRLQDGGFAFMKVTPEWIKFYGNILLLSPEIFVEFNRFRRIVLWIAEQDKEID